MARHGRRRRQEEPDNLDRWLVSYADFITLLFAFFVVMYAISSVNEGKYRVLSETLSTVFSIEPRSDEPIQVGEKARELVPVADGQLSAEQIVERVEALATPEQEAETEPTKPEPTKPEPKEPRPERRFDIDDDATRAADEVQISLQQYIDRDLVNINKSKGRIEIEIKDRMLFGSGDARLSRQALGALRDLAESMRRIPNHLQIEGHTDDVPISTGQFPSNWELSAARAASVVHYLARNGVEPYRMAAVGLGEHRPLVDNTDDKSRSANRRVTVVILTGQRQTETVIDQEVPWAEGPAVNAR